MMKNKNLYRLIVRRLAAVSAVATVLVVSAGSPGQANAVAPLARAAGHVVAMATRFATVPPPGPGSPQAGLYPNLNTATKLDRALVAAQLAAPLTNLPAGTCTLSG